MGQTEMVQMVGKRVSRCDRAMNVMMKGCFFKKEPQVIQDCDCVAPPCVTICLRLQRLRRLVLAAIAPDSTNCGERQSGDAS